MQLFRKVSLFLFLLLFSIAAYSQQHLVKTLLWRISGNGLQKPSYLFGTMHLTDKRLFNFTDSVYKAIEKTDGLAIEVNPDEMAAYIINKAFDQLEGKKLREMLDDKDFKKYSPDLEKKFGKPAGEITSNDIVREKNKWMSDYLQKGEMPTFVDAYLYSLAKKQGKWIGGIEDMSDQAGLMDDIVDKSDIRYLLADDKTSGDNTLEKMITTYASQDIEAIESLTNAGTSAEMKDRLLITRNIKMARRIDSLAAFRTMFFAIGAAHLPGDSGVIQLLQARGFMVEPVMSDKKIAANDYKVKEVEIPWTEVKDELGLYTVSMPGNPAPIKLFGLLDIKFLFDLTSLSGFYTMAVINPGEIRNNDSLFNELAKRMFKGQKINKPKKISKDGTEGREFLQEQDNLNMRIQVFISGRVMYLAMAYALKKEGVSSPATEKFFTSFTINKNYAANSISSVFTDSIMGVSFTSPAALTPNPKLTANPDPSWKLTAYTGTDMGTGSYVMLFSKEVKAGNVIVSDSLVYGQFFLLLKKQYTGINITDTILQGVRTLLVQGKSVQQPNIHIKVLTAIIGNRNILLMVLSDSTHLADPSLAGVFNSFRFLPRPTIAWNQYKSTDAAFTSWAPSPFRIYSDENNSYRHQLAYDTATSTSYFVINDTLNKYSWAENDSTFWKEQTNSFKYTDSIISETKVQNAGLAGMELLMKKRSSKNTFKRLRLVVDGNIVHKLTVSGDRATLFDDNTNKFFAGFRPTVPVKENFITSSKAQVLLDDLASADSATRFKAYGAVWSAPFSVNDISLLHAALFKNYKSLWDSANATLINERIAQSVEKLASPATVAFVKDKYNTFPENRKQFNSITLSLLAGIHTKESYEALAHLLAQPAPKEKMVYSFQGNLKDSLALTLGIYAALLPYAADSALGLSIANVSVTLLDSGLITRQTLAPAEKDFIANAKLQLALMKSQKEEDIDYGVYALIELLGKIKTPEAIAVLKDYLEVSNLYIRKKAVIVLSGIGEAIPAATLTSLAADIEIRTAFYDDLKEINKEKLFPAQYLTQSYFAESAIYSAANDNDEDENSGTASVQFLSKKTAKYNDKSYTFYLYKVSYKGGTETSSYLGVAGGYETGGKALEAAEELTGLYWKEEFDAKNITAQFEAYLKNLEKYADGNDEGSDD